MNNPLPKVENKISVGNWLTIATIVFAAAGSWYSMKEQVALAQERMNTGVEAAQTERARLDRRLTELEVERRELRDRMIRVETMVEQIAKAVGAN